MNTKTSMAGLKPGISVIVPSYQGAQRLPRLLDSLDAQTLDPHLFEVIVVLNGPDDGTAAILAERPEPDFSLRVMRREEAGAARARNVGLACVNRSFITFVDDDDFLEPDFLRVALETANAAPNTVALMPIVDVDETGDRNHNSSLNVRISRLAGGTHALVSHPWVLGFNACKVVPAELLLPHRYAENLRSGEDVAFFANLLRYPHAVLRVPKVEQAREGAYVRAVRSDSVSRKVASFDFNVKQRLEAIAAVRSVAVPESAKRARASLENAQFNFVSDYLRTHPGEVEQAIAYAQKMRVPGLDWQPLRTQKPRRLVVSYCFPPFSDTSATVAAKTIAAKGELVDVISANMSRVRAEDSSTLLIADPYVVRHEQVNVDPSFAAWPLIGAFARKAAQQARAWSRKQGPYESMYTRALWSGSHVAGALIKRDFPDVEWEAEFSDPLCVGADGKPREGKITSGLVKRQLRKVIKQSPWPDLKIDTHFALTEAVTFIAADIVVFTNENQRELMLGVYPDDMQGFVRAKSVIRPHAVPQPEILEAATELRVPGMRNPSTFTIGYFGNFYANRGIGDVVQALAELPKETREKITVKVFCSNPHEVASAASSCDVNVNAHRYLPYVEFLAAAQQMDVLLVGDVDTAHTGLPCNPFLPSKLADYVATGVPIWALLESGSPMDALSKRPDSPFAFTNFNGDKQGLKNTLYGFIATCD